MVEIQHELLEWEALMRSGFVYVFIVDIVFTWLVVLYKCIEPHNTTVVV